MTIVATAVNKSRGLRPVFVLRRHGNITHFQLVRLFASKLRWCHGQCATCDRSHRGSWTGDWEDCHVLSATFAKSGYMGRDRRMETISALIPIHEQSLGLAIKDNVVHRMLPGCDKNLINAGLLYGAKILEIQGTAVKPSHKDADIVNMVKAVTERPIFMRFEWESCVMESYDVQILSDGMECENVPARFIRHKFRTDCESL